MHIVVSETVHVTLTHQLVGTVAFNGLPVGSEINANYEVPASKVIHLATGAAVVGNNNDLSGEVVFEVAKSAEDNKNLNDMVNCANYLRGLGDCAGGFIRITEERNGNVNSWLFGNCCVKEHPAFWNGEKTTVSWTFTNFWQGA